MLNFWFLSLVISSIQINPFFESQVSNKACPNIAMTESFFQTIFANYMTQPTQNQLNNDLISYFYNLYRYSPYNSNGTCGYVSLIQYLSYYDTYYNDSIIPEQYEKHQESQSDIISAKSISPGVLRQPYPTNMSDFYDFVQDNKDTDYQMNLISIYNEQVNNNSSNYDWTIHMRDYQLILNTMPIFSNIDFEYASYSDFGDKPTSPFVIYSFDLLVKHYLDLNLPIILHVGHYNEINNTIENYHSVVAYYYGSEGIHANFGWDSLSTDTIIPSNYQIIDAGLINFNQIEETHSNNYVVNYNHFCGCGTETNHSFGYRITNFSNIKHRLYCWCNESCLENHSFDFSSRQIVNGHIYVRCYVCNSVIDISGDGPIIPVIG